MFRTSLEEVSKAACLRKIKGQGFPLQSLGSRALGVIPKP